MIFAHYVDAGFATQVILIAGLMRFCERDDIIQHLNVMNGSGSLLLERGIDFDETEMRNVEPPSAEAIAGGATTIDIAPRRSWQY